MIQFDNKNIELLAPAGDMEKLTFALEYGADAVYLSGTAFGMRQSASVFTKPMLENAIALTKKKNAKVYVTVNTLPRENEIAGLPAYFEELNELEVDALIIADLGVLALAKKYAPKLDIHISTQGSIVNSAAANAYFDMGAKRVVLARELSLEEIAGIRAATNKALELEAFCHGAMCMSYSGRCFISAYMTGRDANRGACAQPCRWKYHLMEETRPGQYFPVLEEEKGAFILNAKDLATIEILPQLLKAGITSLKIEGRAKSAYYAAVITNAYKLALASAAGQPDNWTVDEQVLREIYCVSHRDYYTGFYESSSASGQHTADNVYIRNFDICAVVEDCDAEGNAKLTQRNKFSEGDRLELLIPGETGKSFTVTVLQAEDGTPLESAPHPMMKLRAKLPGFVPKYSILRRAAPEK